MEDYYGDKLEEMYRDSLAKLSIGENSVPSLGTIAKLRNDHFMKRAEQQALDAMEAWNATDAAIAKARG